LPAVHLDTGFPSISVAVRDLDGDGSNDLVLTGSNSVSVLLQDAANPGTFLAGVVYPAGTRASFVAAADLDDDGFQDLVVTNEGSSNDGSNASVSVLLQDPSDPGTFEPASNYPVANGAQNAVVGDLNGDDAPDIAVVSLVYSAQQPSRVTVWFQDPTMPGKFSSSGVFEGGFSSNFIALGDFNGDGILDILINDGPLILFQNPSSPGSFFAASPLPT
jgi:hypothetical protein